MELIKFFIVTMYVMGFLGILLYFYLRHVYSKDSKKK